MEKEKRDVHTQYLVAFFALVTFICVMSLISGDSLKEIYLFIAQILSISSDRVSGNNATTISNAGHVITSFVLTWVAFYLFQGSFLKAVGSAATLACLIEFAQSFSATRQANIEDILLSFSGIIIALLLAITLKRPSFSPRFNK